MPPRAAQLNKKNCSRYRTGTTPKARTRLSIEPKCVMDKLYCVCEKRSRAKFRCLYGFCNELRAGGHRALSQRLHDCHFSGSGLCGEFDTGFHLPYPACVEGWS